MSVHVIFSGQRLFVRVEEFDVAEKPSPYAETEFFERFGEVVPGASVEGLLLFHVEEEECLISLAVARAMRPGSVWAISGHWARLVTAPGVCGPGM